MEADQHALALMQFITNHQLYHEFVPVAKKHPSDAPIIEMAENFLDERGLLNQLQVELDDTNTPDSPQNTLRAYDGLPITPDLTPEKAAERRARNWHSLRVIDYHAHQHGLLIGRFVLKVNEVTNQLSIYQIIRSTLLRSTLQVLPHFLEGDPIHPEWGERMTITCREAMNLLATRVKTEERLHQDQHLLEQEAS